ncbi:MULTISPECIES: nucleotide exchange factor GrpE [Methylococcus]|uniref:Protein GrpE n=1 Tax=Methylococcus capsulatus TaxID=414 RepID=A0ABZ2F670_METCP|nr:MULTISPECIES: nucleotide exchange factor GrpE [Methylococcus]MDF9393519.1 nucleotide exchange factor GrpE [Methylococcus capsulatus]
MSEEEMTNGPGPEPRPELLEVETAAAEAAPAGEPDKALLEAQQQASENWDRFVRAQAEMENLRRRLEKDIQNAHKYALEKFAKELLPVMDSLELGIAASTADAPDVAKLREGAELTLKQFQNVFEKFGIVALDPVGEKFNPEQHQAMAMEPAGEAEPNTVVKVYQKGYLLNDRLLRPALVVVAQA